MDINFKKFSSLSILVLLISLFFLTFQLEKPYHSIICKPNLSKFEFTKENDENQGVSRYSCRKYLSDDEKMLITDKNRPISEYTFNEQFSKAVILLLIIICGYVTLSYSNLNDHKASASFILLGFSIYLAESNMIFQPMQFLYGLIFLTLILLFCCKQKKWGSAFMLILGFATLAFSSLLDFVSEHQVLSGSIVNFFHSLSEKISEERVDFIGEFFILAASLVYFKDQVLNLVINKFPVFAMLCFSSIIIGIGNGFLHFANRPWLRIQALGIVLSLIGLMIIFLLYKMSLKINLKDFIFKHIRFWGSLFIVFVFIPFLMLKQWLIFFNIIVWPTMFFIIYNKVSNFSIQEEKNVN